MNRLYALCAAIAAACLLSACERPPVVAVQSGFRGTGMDQIVNPRIVEGRASNNTMPESLPVAASDGPRASEVFQNVKVLGHLSVGEFTRVMTNMAQWVSPEQGCAYCHNPANFADDGIYRKIVARRMLQMTMKINADWKNHVADTGVTCFTCHRGAPVPKNVWFAPKPDLQAARMVGSKAGQNQPAEAAGGTSLPSDPFTPFLLDDQSSRVIGATALPTGNRQSIKQTEWTYSLMTHMSGALGVNCVFCHNSRSFASWESSTPQRGTAWYGIRMARDLNKNYMEPLTANFPVDRLGPTGDVAKVNCATCHQGASKPLNGAPMLKAHPELAKPGTQVAALAAAVASSAGK